MHRVIIFLSIISLFYIPTSAKITKQDIAKYSDYIVKTSDVNSLKNYGELKPLISKDVRTSKKWDNYYILKMECLVFSK